MGKSRRTYTSRDENAVLRVWSDGSKAELLLNEGATFIDSSVLEELLREAEVVYGFENAQQYCDREQVARDRGEYFPVAIADDSSFEVKVEILIEPLECMLSSQLFSLSDLERYRYLTAGEKLAKVKAGEKGGLQNRNIFGHQVKDLVTDKNFLETYIGSNVNFDVRRNAIVAKCDGYALVENSKRISIVDNIFLQQDIIDGDFEVKTGLTLEGSIFNSSLKVMGDLKVLGKIEKCEKAGIVATGNMVIKTAEESLLICQGNLDFQESLQNCEVYCDGYVKGSKVSTIAGGNIQCGRYIEAGRIGSEAGNETVTEISIAPFLKSQMIRLSRSLRRKEWDYANPDSEDSEVRELKELETRYLKVLPDFISLQREEKRIVCFEGILPPVQQRIFHLSRLVESESDPLSFDLESQEG